MVHIDEHVGIAPAATPPDSVGDAVYHKLHRPDGLLACGYCSRRGYAAPFLRKYSK